MSCLIQASVVETFIKTQRWMEIFHSGTDVSHKEENTQHFHFILSFASDDLQQAFSSSFILLMRNQNLGCYNNSSAHMLFF